MCRAIEGSNERVLPLEAVQIMGMVNYIQTGREKLNNNILQPSEKLFFNKEGGSYLNGVLRYMIQELKSHEPRLESLLHLRASVITKMAQEIQPEESAIPGRSQIYQQHGKVSDQ